MIWVGYRVGPLLVPPRGWSGLQGGGGVTDSLRFGNYSPPPPFFWGGGGGPLTDPGFAISKFTAPSFHGSSRTDTFQ